MKPNLPIKHGQNYSFAQAGAWDDLPQHVFQHSRLGATPGKLFLKEALQMSALEISLGSIPPGRGLPFLHQHRQNEEVYIFVKGTGQFLIDGEILNVQEGSVVRVAPAGARAWRNTGSTPLHYIVIQAKAGTLDTGTITDGVPVPGEPPWPK